MLVDATCDNYMSLTGLLMGFAGWMLKRRMTPDLSLPVVDLFLSVATLILGIVLTGQGMEIFKLQAL